ncbi:MAG: siroheme synthase CysG [Thiotrichales bacterium]
MDFFPVFLNLQQRECLVVGGGEVAARKASMLHSAGARIALVAPELCREIAERVHAGDYRYFARRFEAIDLDDKALVIAATDSTEVNREIATLASARNLPVNVVDNPALCSFIVPSLIDRSPVQVAISTGGASPVLARMLRARLESQIPAGFGQLGALLNEFRDEAKSALATLEQRRTFWEEIVDGPVAEMVLSGNTQAARELLANLLEDAAANARASGEVYLIGAGPGDPDLLTFKAVRLMQRADVVVYDRLVSEPILRMVRRDAERIYVGKERSHHTMRQENINQLLVRLAKDGKRVVRLKGGDPFIFGRGGEEIETLIDEGVRFQVVPGITAAAGCAAYAGIPLTHRDYSQACIFVTGHLKDGTTDLNWEMLAHRNQTVVFYMGLHGVETLCRELIAHGREPEIPVALVERGTLPDQKVYLGTLATLPELVHGYDIKPPTLIIVGEVVAMHEKLKWYMLDQEYCAKA